MKTFILAAIATATLATPFVASAADAQVRRTVTVERGHHREVVRRVIVRRPEHRGWQHRHQGYVTRRVVTHYR